MTTAFGRELRRWRDLRRVSQLQLSLEAGVSSRHLSFLESGRAQPSRAMVLRLAEHLGVPREARNALLGAAGYAPAWRRRAPEDTALAPLTAALRRMLDRHAPFPAIAFDRHWRITDANGPALQLFGAFGIGPGASLLDAMLDPAGLGAAIANMPDVARETAARLRAELAHFGPDAALETAAAGFALLAADAAPDPGDAVVTPVRIRVGDLELSFLSTLAQFGSANDIALADMRIELFFPLDAVTERTLEELAGV